MKLQSFYSYLVQNRRGFTLIEIMVTVMVIVILVTMAVPMYQRAIEKSRKAEISVMLKKFGDAKLRAMDARNIINYTSGTFDFSDLDVTGKTTSQNMQYGLYPVLFPNAVCAKRADGTTFLYLGDAADDICAGSSNAICNSYKGTGDRLFCSGAKCEVFGMESVSIGDCNIH